MFGQKKTDENNNNNNHQHRHRRKTDSKLRSQVNAVADDDYNDDHHHWMHDVSYTHNRTLARTHN